MDHFHDLSDKVGGKTYTVKFDKDGNATSGGHLHLEADAVYKIELKAWDYAGREVQGEYLKSKAVADQYKAFIIGGDLILNPQTNDESGAAFQPRERTYGDGTTVNGKYETTGITGYLTIGHANESLASRMTYVLRKLNAGVKATIERTDWNDKNYATRFAGENVLELKFEIHIEEDHHH